MVEISKGHETPADTMKGFDASSIAGGARSIYDNLPAVVQGTLNQVEKYVAATFGTPSIGDFHNISDASSKDNTTALSGHLPEFGSGDKIQTMQQADGPTIPDWPTGSPAGKMLNLQNLSF